MKKKPKPRVELDKCAVDSMLHASREVSRRLVEAGVRMGLIGPPLPGLLAPPPPRSEVARENP